MNIEIRKATINDVDSFYKLGVEFNKFNEELSHNHNEFFHEGWEKDFYTQSEDSLKDGNHAVFLASLDGKDVGYMHCYVCDECYYTILDELFIQKNYRKYGLGKMFVEKFITWASQYDYTLKVEVYNWNNDAIEFYKRMGFDPTSTILEKHLP